MLYKLCNFFIEERLVIYLLILKISPNLRGYAFLKKGVIKIVEDCTKKHNVNNRLYCEIAKEFNISQDLVDRAMRHAIDVSVKRKGITDFERRLKIDFSSPHPTPKELLCTIAEKIIVEKKSFINKWKN